MTAKRSSSALSLIIFMVGFLILVIPFHIRPENSIVDDGYFYPEIARHIAHGQGSTFNGFTLTNGYHPLWMLLCAAGAFIISSPTKLVQVLSGMQDLMILLSLLGIVLLARAAKLRGAIYSFFFMMFFYVGLSMWHMIEFPLTLLLQILALTLAVPVLPSLNTRAVRLPALGIALGATMLSRLDSIFFIGILLAYQFIRSNKTSSIAKRTIQVLVPGLICGLIVAPYLAWNWITFHHLMPISGAIKSSFPHIHKWFLPAFTLPVWAAILFNGFVLSFKKSKTSYDIACLLSAYGAALHLMYTLSFGDIAPWYLVSGFISFALLVPRLVDTIYKRVPLAERFEKPVAAVLFVVYFAFGMVRASSNLSYTRLLSGQFSLHQTYREPKRAFAQQLVQILPPNSNAIIFDAPGGVAFYSGLNILPTDGLVSDYQYNDLLAKEGMLKYARNHNIHYLIAPKVRADQLFHRLALEIHREGNNQIFSFEAPLTKQPAGSIALSDSNLVLTFREINPDLEKSFPEIGVWRID